MIRRGYDGGGQRYALNCHTRTWCMVDADGRGDGDDGDTGWARVQGRELPHSYLSRS